MSTEAEASDAMTPEGAARKTIDNLIGGKLSPRTVDDVAKAAQRAVSDKAITGRKW
jgi:hypothetical protein